MNPGCIWCNSNLGCITGSWNSQDIIDCKDWRIGFCEAELKILVWIGVAVISFALVLCWLLVMFWFYWTKGAFLFQPIIAPKNVSATSSITAINFGSAPNFTATTTNT